MARILTSLLLVAAGVVLSLALGPLLNANSSRSVVLGWAGLGLVAAAVWRVRRAGWRQVAGALLALPFGYALPVLLLAVAD